MFHGRAFHRERSGLRTFLCGSNENVEYVFVERIHQLFSLLDLNTAEQIKSHDHALQGGNGLMQKLHDYDCPAIWCLLEQELAIAAISFCW